MPEKDMAAFRIEYEQAGLDERDLDADPFVVFDRWFADAAGAGISEPNAMVVATVGRDGQPTARTILLKEVRDRRFVFFTNYRSRKGEELAANPRIGGAASPQSRPIPDRAWLEERVQAIESEYPDGNVPRPDHWGGYAVTPTLFEFWQGRPNRLHDRIRYRLEEGWVMDRLAP